MARITALLTFWLLSGCAAPTSLPQPVGQPDMTIAWPKAPDSHRIRFLHAFAGPEDLGYSQQFSKRLKQLFAGPENETMVRPYAIAVNEQWIAVADPGAATVHLFNPLKKTYQRISRAGRVALESPVGIALGDDRIYVSDSVLNKVFVLDRQRNLISVLDNFQRPTALAYDPASQRLYVTDTLGQEILVFDQAGRTVQRIGERGSRDGQFNFPTHIAIANGHLYVNDTLNFRVQVFALDGRHLHTFGVHGDSPGYLSQPKGLAVNSQGHVFVSEAVTNRVQVFNLDGEFLIDFGSSGNQLAAFTMPAGIAIANDRIYVADSGNRRVQVFEYLGDE